MKTIRLFFFAYILCSINSLIAQEEMGTGFLLPQFENGIVIFKDGSRSAASLNYSMLNQEMLFMDVNKEIKAIANVPKILAVIIGEKRFVPASSKNIFYEEIEVENGFFFVQHKATMVSAGKAAAYGGYSQTTSTTSYTTYSTGAGNIYELKPDEKFRLKMETLYYIQSGKSYKRFFSAKTLGKLFKGHESKIEEYAKNQSTDFSKIDEISDIVEYGFSLAKK